LVFKELEGVLKEGYWGEKGKFEGEDEWGD
jgi:hypothetical protein